MWISNGFFLLLKSTLGDGVDDVGKGGVVGTIFCGKKNAISPFFDASGNKNIGATIRIG